MLNYNIINHLKRAKRQIYAPIAPTSITIELIDNRLTIESSNHYLPDGADDALSKGLKELLSALDDEISDVNKLEREMVPLDGDDEDAFLEGVLDLIL